MPPDLINCTFSGNSDFYGIGVRLGFYVQWFSGLIAFIINPEDSDTQADAQTIFLLANLIALIVLQVQEAEATPQVVPILLFYMFFGGSVSAVTSATTSLAGWNKAIPTKKIALIARQMFVQMTFFMTLAYSFYFWVEGFKEFEHYPDHCKTYVFPIPHRVLLDTPSTGSVLALFLLMVFYLLIWFVAYKRLRNSLPPHIPLTGSKFAIDYGPEGKPLPPWEGKQRYWTITGGILIALVTMWSITGIELTLKRNHITDVNDLCGAGQLIPFIIGVASLLSALWGALENWQAFTEESHKFQRLRSPESNQQLFSKEGSQAG